ncbi:uncharacterized protein LOC129893449 [Solanum dulcamara]|uniref:uncharacterized protein LOC129893449 n=1 Tax=Solanum dulcamara TaxID=45834 RepID=UPI002485AD8F|nr:uncharacterized protein LOC129893449 [Solanum dulcamara]
MSGEIIQGKAKNLFLKMYGQTNPEFSFSSGWLERFKLRCKIKSYTCFGESSSVIMKNIENELPNIQSKLDQFELKDIYNMDETGLFYRLEADHSLATKQLEDEGIQGIGELDEGIQELNDVISNLAYINVMDVEHLLNYPKENDTIMKSPIEEEIIQYVMNNDDENDPEQDNSSIVPHVSSKKAFQAMTTLSNYLNIGMTKEDEEDGFNQGNPSPSPSKSKKTGLQLEWTMWREIV